MCPVFYESMNPMASLLPYAGSLSGMQGIRLLPTSSGGVSHSLLLTSENQSAGKPAVAESALPATRILSKIHRL